MKNRIDYSNLLTRLAMLAFCMVFWVLVFKCKVVLYGLLVITIIMILIIREELE